jgi:hypothetical protein
VDEMTEIIETARRLAKETSEIKPRDTGVIMQQLIFECIARCFDEAINGDQPSRDRVIEDE